jgi:hypothetical protein
MQAAPRKSLPLRFRRLAAGFCTAVLSVQLALPAVHEIHRSNVSRAGEQVLVAAAEQHAGDTAHAHDAAACPVCRTTSDLRTLIPVGAVHVVAIIAIARSREEERPHDGGTQVPRGLAARGPPSLD